MLLDRFYAWHNALDWWPWPVLLLVLAGLIVAARERSLPRLIPLLLAVSQIACFTLVVGRIGHRFTLPSGFWLAAYAGVAAAYLSARFGHFAREAVGLVWLWALAQTLSVQVAQWSDARRPVEAWLAQLPAHTRVLVAGPTVSQPRWGLGDLARLDVARLGPQPADRRNPLPGVQERQGNLEDLPQTRPDVIVLPASFAGEFVPRPLRPGEQMQRQVEEKRAAGGLGFFAGVAAGQVPGYRVVRVANRYPRWLERVGLHLPHVHSSVGEDEIVLIRADAHVPPLAGSDTP